MTENILIAGFGGQGILFTGKVLAYKGLLEGRNLSWLPSYGPEMRGGTCNCGVILSDEPVGSPIVNHPDVLVAMNLPSLDKYEADVAPGGKIFVDSALIERRVERTDVDVYYVPVTRMAMDNGTPGLANMIMLGKVFKECGMRTDDIEETLKKVIPAKHADLFDANMSCIRLGMEQ
ncbi:MAG: 2-oxoacid:acceptor oxidoreductase family protein [Eubacteriaceae bacterium]|nr:2-oxoacid:acceptor oxidoreductase family protein [Eubacteriaceae bacterium]